MNIMTEKRGRVNPMIVSEHRKSTLVLDVVVIYVYWHVTVNNVRNNKHKYEFCSASTGFIFIFMCYSVDKRALYVISTSNIGPQIYQLITNSKDERNKSVHSHAFCFCLAHCG